MIESVNDKYINFLSTFTSEDGLYSWTPNVRYRLTGKDDNNYYIGRHNLDPYKISKEFEGIVYKIGEMKQENRR